MHVSWYNGEMWKKKQPEPPKVHSYETQNLGKVAPETDTENNAPGAPGEIVIEPQQTTPPEPPKPEKPKDPVQRMIELEEQNKMLLAQIAVNQDMIRTNTGKILNIFRMAFWTRMVMLVLLVGVTIASIYYMPKIIQTTTDMMMGSMFGGTSPGATDISQEIDPANIQNILEGLDLNAIFSN